jgi:hypothetical protein
MSMAKGTVLMEKEVEKQRHRSVYFQHQAEYCEGLKSVSRVKVQSLFL